MEYIQAEKEDLLTVFNIVQDTIKKIYPKYYPEEVVEFFCTLHSKENIEKDICNHSVGLLINDGIVVGTGCYNENHITRVYVLPKYQKKGYGTYIMSMLEAKIAQKFQQVYLDASLPASHLYEKRGYVTKEHCEWEVENSVILVYEVMEKELVVNSSKINYDGKIFVPKSNSDNGEVNEQTIFHYHQKGEEFYADYSGGEVRKGFMVGTVSDNGELDFCYQHLNINNEIKAGKCHSVPVYLENGRVELHEEWQWMNGDCSKGNSIVMER